MQGLGCVLSSSVQPDSTMEILIALLVCTVEFTASICLHPRPLRACAKPLVSSYNLRRRSVHTVGVGETGTRHVPINVFHSQICCSEPYLQTEGACTERRADKLTPPPSYTASMLNDHIWQCVSQKSPYFTGTAIPRGCAWSWSW